MANRIQTLMVVLGAAAVGALPSASGADFSHKVHTRLVRDCAKCHTAARASTKAEDNLLPRAESCRPCHSERKVRAAATKTTVIRFNHALHGQAVPGGCVGCHKGVPAAEKPGLALFPAMEQCLVCHTKIEPLDSCAQCHDVGPHLKPATHTANWGDRHTDEKIPKQGCWVCHGKQFTCQGCH